jgi:hypothetical protein
VEDDGVWLADVEEELVIHGRRCSHGLSLLRIVGRVHVPCQE